MYTCSCDDNENKLTKAASAWTRNKSVTQGRGRARVAFRTSASPYVVDHLPGRPLLYISPRVHKWTRCQPALLQPDMRSIWYKLLITYLSTRYAVKPDFFFPKLIEDHSHACRSSHVCPDQTYRQHYYTVRARVSPSIHTRSKRPAS